MPKKPTSPYGYISFSKDGKVRKHVSTLSQDKPIQEKQVVEAFVKGYNSHLEGRKIRGWKALPENDQDFLLTVDGGAVLMEVTELVDREFAFPMTREEYNAGRFEVTVQKDYGEIPWRIDIEKMNDALSALIDKKLEKHYAKEGGKELWLLVFTVVSFYETEYVRQGTLHTSPALDNARTLLARTPDVVFDEIWFTDMMTRPVPIWPSAIME